jgi:hypothetical protein
MGRALVYSTLDQTNARSTSGAAARVTATRSSEMTLTAPPMINGEDVSFVSGLRGRGGLLIRLVRRAVTISSKG